MSSVKREKHKIPADKRRRRSVWLIKPTERIHGEAGYSRGREKKAVGREVEEEIEESGE